MSVKIVSQNMLSVNEIMSQIKEAVNDVQQKNFDSRKTYSYVDFVKYDDEHFIDEVYKVILDRDADVDGKNYYLSMLRKRMMSKQEIVDDVRFSQEGEAKGLKFRKAYSYEDFIKYDDEHFIEEIYKVLLNRNADNDGKNYYLDKLRNGLLTKKEVVESIRFSEEGNHQGVDYRHTYSYIDFMKYEGEEFITKVYKAILDRDVDEDGKNYFLSKLQSGLMSKQEIIDMIRFSKEGEQQNIKYDIATFNNETMNDQVLTSLLQNQKKFEHKEVYDYADFMKYDDDEFLDYVYKSILNRDLDENGKAHYLHKLRMGLLSKKEIIESIRFSKEGKTKGVELNRLKTKYISYKIKRLPFLGRFLRWTKYFVGLPGLVKEYRHYNAMHAMKNQQNVNAMHEMKRILDNKANIQNFEQILIELDNKVSKNELRNYNEMIEMELDNKLGNKIIETEADDKKGKKTATQSFSRKSPKRNTIREKVTKNRKIQNRRPNRIKQSTVKK